MGSIADCEVIEYRVHKLDPLPSGDLFVGHRVELGDYLAHPRVLLQVHGSSKRGDLL